MSMGKAKTKVFRKVTRLRNRLALFYDLGIAPPGRSLASVKLNDLIPKACRPVEGKTTPVGDFVFTVEFTPRAAKARSKR